MLRPLRLIGIAVLVLGILGGAAPTPDYQQAYVYALRCFVVVSAYDNEAKAKTAYNAWVRLGRTLGYSDSKLQNDFAFWTPREHLKVQTNSGYKQQMIGTCRKLGLLN